MLSALSLWFFFFFFLLFFFQAEDGIRDLVRSRGSEMCIRDSIVSCDIDGDGKEEFIVGTTDGRLLAIGTDEGGQLSLIHI